MFTDSIKEQPLPMWSWYVTCFPKLSMLRLTWNVIGTMFVSITVVCFSRLSGTANINTKFCIKWISKNTTWYTWNVLRMWRHELTSSHGCNFLRKALRVWQSRWLCISLTANKWYSNSESPSLTMPRYMKKAFILACTLSVHRKCEMNIFSVQVSKASSQT